MKVDLPLEEMTLEDKLQAMDLLWADLSRNAPDEATPEWHGEVLLERERRVASGEERVIDWEEAKRQLGRETHEGPGS